MYIDLFPALPYCNASSFAQVVQGKKVCWVCGGDHLANVCPHRDKVPRDKWYKNTMDSHHTFLKSAYVHYVKGDTTSLNNTVNQTVVENQYQENENSGDSGQRVSWDSFPSHMQIVTSHAEKAVTCEQKTIILDSGSTMSVFMTKIWYMISRNLITQLNCYKCRVKDSVKASYGSRIRISMV